MQPIINPWIFYLIDVLGSLKFIAIIAVFASCLVIFVGGTAIIGATYYDDEIFLAKKTLKGGIIAISICIAIIVFVPSQTAMYTMLTASMVTEDNLDKATKVIQDGVDYIFEKIDGEESSE